MFTVVSVIIFFNFLFIPNYPDALRVVMYAIVIFLAILILLAWLYLFPVIVHYQLNVRDYIRVILRVAVESVPSILVQLMILAIYAGIVNYLPALLVLLGVTPFAIAQMAISYNMLNRIERKEK
ncbi:hypothetical protein [Bacillus sp. JCM 19034]|uniref:hypothetical protein n=1 Tax=Bacillus sp. JCM 19034 TaxID=1481928 RepID=UPI0012E302BD|nr:hypothetical protein [Bacillus sp. JCM 19034]